MGTMRGSRTLAAISLAILLGAGLIGPSRTQAHRAPGVSAGGFIFAGLQDGHIYRTADGGGTWQEADGGLTLSWNHILSLAAAPGGILYAGTRGSGLWASADDGQSWQPANGGGAGTIPAAGTVLAVAVDPSNARHVFALAESGVLYRTQDGGRSWSGLPVPGAKPLVLALDPLRPTTLLLGDEYAGLHISTDGGQTWTSPAPWLPRAGGPGSSQFDALYSIAGLTFDPRNPDVAYAGTLASLYRSGDGGRTWQEQPLPLANATALAVDPSGLDGVLVGTSTNGFDTLQTGIARSANGRTWGMATLPAGFKAAGITAFAFDPAHPGRVLAGVQGGPPLQSTDGGGAWQEEPCPGAAAGCGITALVAAAPAVAPAGPPPGGYIFAGMSDGHIYRSPDGGATWEEADTGLTISGVDIVSLAVAPDGTTIYAGTAYRGLWSSADDGASWQPADGSGADVIPPDAGVYGVIDPLEGRHLFAISYDTFYESKDGGQSWLVRAWPYGNLTTMTQDPERPGTLLVGTS